MTSTPMLGTRLPLSSTIINTPYLSVPIAYKRVRRRIDHHTNAQKATNSLTDRLAWRQRPWGWVDTIAVR